MTDLAVTYMAGEAFCRSPMVAVYAASSARHFRGDRVVLTHEMGDPERSSLTRQGFRVVDCRPPEGSGLLRHRWGALADLLCGRRHRYVLFTDCKDVLWQRDPVPDLEAVGGDRFVAMCHEGVVHRQCGWNSREQAELRRACLGPPPDFGAWEVVNGGVVAGTYSEMKDLAFLMYSVTIMGRAPVSDQAFLNHVFHSRRGDPGSPYVLVDPAATPYAATGNTIATQPTPFAWEGGRLVDAAKRPFALFHQWDRTGARGEILAALAGGFS